MPHKDPEARKAYERKRYKANRERYLRRAKKRYRLHREKLKAYAKEYRKKNRASTQATIMKWRKTNGRVRWIESCRRRKASKHDATVPLTEVERQEIYAMEEKRLKLKSKTGKMYHVDHIIPLFHGGIHHPINLRILSISKNSKKQHSITTEAIDLVSECYRLYFERLGIKKAEWFRKKIANAIGAAKTNRLIRSPKQVSTGR
jgi:hypothetical protein